PVTWSFTTAANIAGPTVVSTTPPSGESGVALGSVISATFNEAVQSGTISFVLEDPTESLVPATLSYNSTTFTAILTPNAPLAPSTTYEALLSNAQDLSGNPMASAVTWNFTTASGTLVPTVVSQTPPPGAANISIATI